MSKITKLSLILLKLCEENCSLYVDSFSGYCVTYINVCVHCAGGTLPVTTRQPPPGQTPRQIIIIIIIFNFFYLLLLLLNADYYSGVKSKDC